MKSRAKSKSTKALTAADLYWSDEDEDPLRKYVLQLEAPPVDQSDDDDSNAAVFRLEDETTEEASVLHEDHLSEHKRSTLFQGYVHVDRNKVVKLLDTSKPVVAQHQHQQQYPQVFSQTRHKLGDRVLTLLWKYFIDCGCDASELLQMHHLPRISKLLEDNYNVSLPFSKIKQVKLLEPDDYTSFSDVADQLSHHFVKPVVVMEPNDRLCQLCCTYGACRHKLERRMEDGGQAPDMQPDSNREYADSQKYLESNEHKLNIIYTQLMSNLNGRLRIKNILDILRELCITFDKQRLPKVFWDNRGELLVTSLDELRELIETLRTDREGVVDPYAGLYKYELPGWLREEFQDSEVLLYEHHFSLIDIDQGGSVDVDELQQLIGSFGGFISRDDAQALLDAYDLDGGGTIDFFEFMVLIYKIQRGTVDLTTNELAQILTEAKSQLAIFEEIIEVSRNPPPYCTVHHFGGSPVTCEFLIAGPVGSPYEGFRITLKMVFLDGYPYRQPDIQFQERVLGLHILPQLSGQARFMHMKWVWDATWTMHRMLTHTVDILSHPEPSLLPDNLFDLYSSWQQELGRKCRSYELDLIQEQEELVASIYEIVDDDVVMEEIQGLCSESYVEVDLEYAERLAAEKADHKAQSKRPSSNKRRDGGTSTVKDDDKSTVKAVDGKHELKTYSEDKYADGREHGRDEKQSRKKSDDKGKDSDDNDDTNDSSSSSSEPILIPRKLLDQKRREYVLSLSVADLCELHSIKNRVHSLSRIEQMHLQTMFAYLVDAEKYFDTVRDFMVREGERRDLFMNEEEAS